VRSTAAVYGSIGFLVAAAAALAAGARFEVALTRGLTAAVVAGATAWFAVRALWALVAQESKKKDNAPAAKAAPGVRGK
jgi:hypothetical protein